MARTERRMMEKAQLRAAVFIPPFHATNEDPTLALERNFALVEHLDRLDFDEAWIGEHHSGGWEIIGAPDLFIAEAAVRTRRIRLGTGVLALPYYHPFIVADRIMQLDHQTRGRAMFGFGPGILPPDALATGVPVDQVRDRMEAALDAVVRLVNGERVSGETGGFTMRDAKLQWKSYTYPRPQLLVASSGTPNGGRLAGKYGLGMLSSGFNDRYGFESLELNYRVAVETAAEYGQRFERSMWRVSAPFHIAPTRAEALADVADGYERWCTYRQALSPSGGAILGITSLDDINGKQRGAVGTPDDAVAVLEQLWDRTGGFGHIVMIDHGWAGWDATRRSYDLFARYVMPKFAGRNAARDESLASTASVAAEVGASMRAGAQRVVDRYLGR